ncbi:MAG: deoxyribodipyrimidine photolyase [Hyphomicrobium sp.]|nr:deoxyribodipyrimidine photolyase [Hyphomicrobium sp.]
MQSNSEAPPLQAIDDWPASRAEGMERLAHFVARAGRTYAAERNYDLGPQQRANVSVLSPYVRHRLVTEDEVVRAVLGTHSLSAAEKFIQEVCWRTYWKGWLQHRPGVWDRYVAEVAQLTAFAGSDRHLMDRLERAKSGATGIQCFDAWANELVATGYLHNHARMWFASVWIYTLNLPWQLGADFFLRHLLDGDAASNTLSWRWVCGLQTPGKTYLARASNIQEYTGNRFAPATGLASAAPPASDAVPLERAKPLAPRGLQPEGEIALLVTDDDLNPESLDLGRAEVTIAIVLRGTDAAPGYAANVATFRAAARLDCGQRTARHFGCSVEMVDASAADAVDRVTKLARGHPVVVAEIPVGPTRTAVQPLLDALVIGGGTVHQVRRDWDHAFWPHATKGFFQIKDKIPSVLRELGLQA